MGGIIYNLCLLFLLFFAYSVIGYLIEVTYIFFNSGEVNFNRGFLFGPYLPIFGFGAVIISLLFSQYADNVFVLFSASMVICCGLEYFTSIIMENIFHVRWWDYSDRKYNVDGRFCLENGIMFGFGGIVFIKFINPFVVSIITKLSVSNVINIGTVLFIIVLCDFCLSVYLVLRLKLDTKFYQTKDATRYVKKEIRKSLEKRYNLNLHFFKAFPNLLKDNKFFPKEIISRYRKK